ncbi:MAG: plastocyanin/azurin family copper-binding protein [Nitrososphaera sp.]|jgi:plastocyanin
MNKSFVTATVFSTAAVLMVAALVLPAAPRATAQEFQPHELTIAASNTSGSEMDGIWMSIRFTNGTYIGSGYTPLTFPGEPGGTYVVTAANYDGIAFAQWEDGSTQSNRTITLPADTNTTRITAQYDAGNSVSGLTPLQFNGTAGQPSLMVSAMQGSDTLNMWTLIQPNNDDDNGTQTTNATATYKVYAGNFENHVFDHWSDGNKDRIRTLTVNENTTLTAFYKAGEATIIIPQGAEDPGNAPYQPSELTVKRGVKIVVSNVDEAPHSVTSGTGPEDPTAANAFETGLMFLGGFAHIETENLHAGDYPFYCFVHPWMKGKLTVTE